MPIGKRLICHRRYMLGQDKFEVKTVSLTKDIVTSIGGFRTVPDYDIHSVPEDYEAVILIGGMTWRNENAQQVKMLVEKCVENGKVLGGYLVTLLRF